MGYSLLSDINGNTISTKDMKLTPSAEKQLEVKNNKTMSNLYYIAPDQDIFEEVKSKCMEIWDTYDDEYGYASQKKNQIDVENVSDNFMYMIAMFDSQNQRKLSSMLSEESKKQIRDRMLDGGTPIEYIYF
jgi:hypothetical protein